MASTERFVHYTMRHRHDKGSPSAVNDEYQFWSEYAVAPVIKYDCYMDKVLLIILLFIKH